MGVFGCGGNLDTAGASLPDHNVGEWESGRNGNTVGQAGRVNRTEPEYAVSQVKLVQNIFKTTTTNKTKTKQEDMPSPSAGLEALAV